MVLDIYDFADPDLDSSGGDSAILALAGKPVGLPCEMNKYGAYSRSSLRDYRAWYDLGCFVDELGISREKVLKRLNTMCVQGVLERRKGSQIPGEQAIVSTKTMLKVGKRHSTLWFYTKA